MFPKWLPRLGKNINLWRFGQVARWTRHLMPLLGERGRVLLCDTRDVIFQSNPFQTPWGGEWEMGSGSASASASASEKGEGDIGENTEGRAGDAGGVSGGGNNISSEPPVETESTRRKPRIFLMEENSDMSIGTCFLNRDWMRECEGPDAIALTAERPILCAGTVAGSAEAVAGYAAKMARGCSTRTSAHGVDQVQF